MTSNEKGVVAQAIEAVSSAVHTLPPAYIIQAVLNVIFVGFLFWYLHVQQADRTELLRQVLNTCVPRVNP